MRSIHKIILKRTHGTVRIYKELWNNVLVYKIAVIVLMDSVFTGMSIIFSYHSGFLQMIWEFDLWKLSYYKKYSNLYVYIGK